MYGHREKIYACFVDFKKAFDSVWHEGLLHELLQIDVGGCFYLCINDLPYALQNTLSDPIILPNGTKLNSLLYADDLIILSRSKVGLQNCLNTLYSFSSSWMLDINSKKTKIMIFQKRAKKNSDLEFHIRKQNIDIVHEYTYLGTRISSTGNFNASLEHLGSLPETGF